MLIEVAFPQDVKIRVDGYIFEGAGPVALIGMRHCKYMGDSAVTPGKEPLDIRPARNVRMNPEVGDLAQISPNFFYLFF